MVGGATPWTFTYTLAHGYVSAYVRASGACPRPGSCCERQATEKLRGVARHKLGSIVTENEIAILDVDNHIRLAIMMHVTERKSDGDEVIPFGNHAGANVIK